MPGFADLVVRLTAESSGLTGPMGKANRSINDLGGTAQKSTGKLGGLANKFKGLPPIAQGAMLGAGVAVIGFGVASVNAAADFDKSMREVFTLMPGISDAAMGAMKDDVRDLSKEMGIATTETVPALYQAISAGVPQENVFEFMEVASKAAIGGVTDLETAVDGITSATNAYGIQNLSAQKAADLMFTAVKGGKTTFDQLSASLFQVAPIAAGLKIEFGDITAAMASLTFQGVPTRQAATQLKAAMAELGKEGTIADKAFRTAAGVGFPQFIASGGNLKDALVLMKAAADESGSSVSNMFGSIEAGQSVLALTSEAGLPKFAAEMDAAANSAGSLAGAFEVMDEGPARSMEKMGVLVSDLMIEFGEALLPIVETLMPPLVSLLSAASTVFGVLNVVLKPIAPHLDKIAIAVALLFGGPIVVGIATVVALGKAFSALQGAFDTSGRAAKQVTRDLELLAAQDRVLEDDIGRAVGTFAKYDARLGSTGEAFGQLQKQLELTDEDFQLFVEVQAASSEEMGRSEGQAQALRDELARLEERTGKTADEIRKLQKAARDTVPAFEEVMGKSLLFEGSLDDLAALATKAQDKLRDDLAGSLKSLDLDLIRSRAEFMKWNDNLETVLQESVGLFDTAADEIETSVDDMLTNIADQIEQNRRFQAALVELAERGLDDLVAGLEEAGPGAAQAAEDFVADPIAAALSDMGLGEITHQEMARVKDMLNANQAPLSNEARRLANTIGLKWDESLGLWVSDTAKRVDEIEAEIRRLDGQQTFSTHTITIGTREVRIGGSGVGGIQRRHGGPVTPLQLYQVGEDGPEWFVSEQRGKIVPDREMPQWLRDNAPHAGGLGTFGATAGGGGDVTIVNVTVPGGFLGTKADVEEGVRRGLLRKGRRNDGTGIRR